MITQICMDPGPGPYERLTTAANEAADLLVLIETAADTITEVTADQHDQVIKGFRRAEGISAAARMARERLEKVLFA